MCVETTRVVVIYYATKENLFYMERAQDNTQLEKDSINCSCFHHIYLDPEIELVTLKKDGENMVPTCLEFTVRDKHKEMLIIWSCYFNSRSIGSSGNTYKWNRT